MTGWIAVSPAQGPAYVRGPLPRVPAVAFQHDQVAGPTGPTGQGVGQGRQQDVVDTGAAGRGHRLQQRSGGVRIQTLVQIAGVRDAGTALRPLAGQFGILRALCLPVRQFLRQAAVRRSLMQMVRPVLQAGTLSGQANRPAARSCW